jgi:hypothetical protein
MFDQAALQFKGRTEIELKEFWLELMNTEMLANGQIQRIYQKAVIFYLKG